jgi:hypothetical protein
MRNVAPDDIKNAAGVFMARLQYAYLGDTMRMKGHW